MSIVIHSRISSPIKQANLLTLSTMQAQKWPITPTPKLTLIAHKTTLVWMCRIRIESAPTVRKNILLVESSHHKHQHQHQHHHHHSQFSSVSHFEQLGFSGKQSSVHYNNWLVWNAQNWVSSSSPLSVPFLGGHLNPLRRIQNLSERVSGESTTNFFDWYFSFFPTVLLVHCIFAISSWDAMHPPDSQTFRHSDSHYALITPTIQPY